MENMSKNILKILNSACEGWTVEHRFDSINKFKFDFAHIRLKIAVEMEGGIYTGTGHVKIGTYLKDMRKYNLAQLKGWIVLRYGYGQEDKIANDIIKAVEKRKTDPMFNIVISPPPLGGGIIEKRQSGITNKIKGGE